MKYYKHCMFAETPKQITKKQADKILYGDKYKDRIIVDYKLELDKTIISIY